MATTPNVDASAPLRFWLWGSDANDVCEHRKCDFRQMHLVGMVETSQDKNTQTATQREFFI
jgi:hypothetical protein